MNATARRRRGTGLYLHVPFCRHHCHYCDFAVTTRHDAQIRTRYAAGLTAELRRVAAAGPAAVAPPGALGPDAPWPAFTSVFVGGGTPTLLAAEDLARVLITARTVLPLADDAEVSVEANPETVTEEGLRTLVQQGGLTRLSLGAQSFAPHVLATLGREHEVAAVGAAVGAARAAGVGQVSVDLIYGTPGESDADWRGALDAALALGVDHVSCYALTVEPATLYARRVLQGRAATPDEDVQAARMALADEVLGEAGLGRYEVSNWARPGCASRHNRTYWRGGDWLGVGTGAHGSWARRRWWQHRSVDRWTAAALAGDGATLGGAEVTTSDQRRSERLLMGLRDVEGVARREVDPLDDRAERRLVAAGLLLADATGIRLTASGLARADAVALALL